MAASPQHLHVGVRDQCPLPILEVDVGREELDMDGTRRSFGGRKMSDMEENQKKNVGKALTTDEIRLRASKWTLAGDAGLLAHLEQFSQTLQSKSQETQNNINALYDAFGDASSTINNVTNQFLALQNSQFVENRVYDDESPNEEQKVYEKVSKEEQEKSLLSQYKRAVELGVKILDTHFEEVQLPPNSDSDEEEVSVENSSLVWKSKNSYSRKRFPLLIGSAEWWADDNVGLGDYEENINPEILSSESESDMDEENTAEKRIRMSSSSSTESERILSKKPKEQIGSEYNDIFAPVGEDLSNVKSDLLSKDNGKLIKSQNVYGIGENINPLSLSENGEEGNSYFPKEDKNYVFDDNEEGNSEEDISSESRVPVTKQNKISNSFTRELESKLSSVANKNIKEQSQKNTQHVKSDKEEKSALFDDNDDNDDLFSSQNSASNALLRKKSIFSEEDDDDQLFGNSANLFSNSKKGATPKKSVKISTPVEKNGSAPKENNSSNLFEKSDKFSNDNLFDGNDDFLFSGKSGLSSSHNSGAPHNDWKMSRDVKFSTPTEQGGHQEVPSGDIFGGVSEIKSNGSSNVESVSAVGHEIDNSFNFSRFSSADNSKDCGFVEPSDFSNNKSRKVESPGLFDPLLTSTRHIASDTSDYKTHRTTSSQIIQTKSDSSVLHSQDNSNSKMGQSENAHFSRYQSDTNKNKGLFDEDDDDDLFQTNKLPNPVKDNNLFDDNENDYLFGSALPKVEKHKPILEEKEENTVVSQKSSLPPVEDDEEGKFSLVDKLKQDSVSMSSSRSSLFDDAIVGKTNLASVFDSDKSTKNSNDLFGQTDENLFEERKTKNFGEHNIEDLFGENPAPETKTNVSSSLFDDLEDADDLFQDNVSKKVFEYHNDDGADLFGNPLKDNDKKPLTEKAFGIIQRKDDTAIGSKPSPGNKTEPDTTGKKFNDNIFGESKKFVKNVSPGDADKIMVKDKPKPKSSPVSSLFGELEDEDEDLFSNVKNRETEKPTGKILEEPESGSKSKRLLNDDAIFKIGNSQDKVTAFPEVEGERVTYDEPLNREPPSYNRKTETSLCSVEKSEENKSISANSTSNTNNGKNDLFSGKENLLDGRTSKLTFSENKILKTENEKKVVEVNDNSCNNPRTDDEKQCEEKTGDGIRPSPPNSLRLNLACNQDNNHSETDGLIISSEKEKVIRKLNIPAGLKINPMCLLPGATIKKNVTAEDLKKETREEKEEERENLGSIESKPPESAPNLLKCLSKDRVKIQARRRPQSRRARHEALRSSGIDFEVNNQEIASVTSRSRSVDDFEKSALTPSAIKSSSDTNVNDPVLVNSVNEMEKVMENADSSSSIFHSVENSPEGLFSSPMLSNPLSPSTDGEDYFNVPELDMNFEKEDQSIFQSNPNDFKNTDNTDDNLLFDSAPVLSPLNPDGGFVKKEKKLDVTITSDNVISEKITDRKIAVDEQDEDNLFKVNEAKSLGTVGEKKSENKFRASNIFDDSDEGDSFLFQTKPVGILGAKEVNKKTLFDDNDEDDDLFNEKLDSRNTKSKTTIDSVSKDQVNKSNVVEKSKEPFIDPLGLITKPG